MGGNGINSYNNAAPVNYLTVHIATEQNTMLFQFIAKSSPFGSVYFLAECSFQIICGTKVQLKALRLHLQKTILMRNPG